MLPRWPLPTCSSVWVGMQFVSLPSGDWDLALLDYSKGLKICGDFFIIREMSCPDMWKTFPLFISTFLIIGSVVGSCKGVTFRVCSLVVKPPSASVSYGVDCGTICMSYC